MTSGNSGDSGDLNHDVAQAVFDRVQMFRDWVMQSGSAHEIAFGGDGSNALKQRCCKRRITGGWFGEPVNSVVSKVQHNT